MLYWCDNTQLKCIFVKLQASRESPMQLHGQESNRGLYYNVASNRCNHLSMQHILLSYALFNQDVFTWSKCIPSPLPTLYNNL
jgi:hypothetical protein